MLQLIDLVVGTCDACEQFRTVAVARATLGEHDSRPPELNENPVLRIREKSNDHESLSLHILVRGTRLYQAFFSSLQQ